MDMTFERIKKIKGHEYRYLVKSVRIEGKVKQQFIKYLGKAPDGEKSDPLKFSEVPEKNKSQSWEEILALRLRQKIVRESIFKPKK